MLDKEIMMDLQVVHFLLSLKNLFSSSSLYVSSLPLLTTLIAWNIASICLKKSGCTWLHKYMYTLVNK